MCIRDRGRGVPSQVGGRVWGYNLKLISTFHNDSTPETPSGKSGVDVSTQSTPWQRPWPGSVPEPAKNEHPLGADSLLGWYPGMRWYLMLKPWRQEGRAKISIWLRLPFLIGKLWSHWASVDEQLAITQLHSCTAVLCYEMYVNYTKDLDLI